MTTISTLSVVQLPPVDKLTANRPSVYGICLLLALAFGPAQRAVATPSMAVAPNQATAAAKVLKRRHGSGYVGVHNLPDASEHPALRTTQPQQEVRIEHEVLPAETLAEIAARYSVSETTLIDENQLGPEPAKLETGQTLTVRTRNPPPPRHHVAHRIRSGETWRSLAGRYLLEQNTLRTWNPHLNGRLMAGKVLDLWIEGEVPDANPAGLGLDVKRAALPLQPVPKLALSVGSPNQGRLLNGAQMPENPDLYMIRRPDYSYGSTHTVEYLQLAIAKFREQSDYRHELIVSDMSRPHGGGFGRHESHRSGRDVDIWLPRTDKVEPGKAVANMREVDWDATWQLVRALIRTGEVQYIFLSRSRQRKLYRAAKAAGYDREALAPVMQYPSAAPEAIVRHAPGHRKHLHVRFHCGPTEDRCR